MTRSAIAENADAMEVGGDIYFEALARRSGQPFRGGAVCWNPAERCEGICHDCRFHNEGGEN